MSMAKAKRRRRSSGFAGLGKSFLADLRGQVVHCVQYGKKGSGKIRCTKFGKGAGTPNPRSRKAAGVKGRFVERSKIKKRPGVRKGKGKKRCIKRGTGKGGRKVCRKWAPTGRALKSKSRRVVSRRGKRKVTRKKGLKTPSGRCRYGKVTRGKRKGQCRKSKPASSGGKKKKKAKGKKRRTTKRGPGTDPFVRARGGSF
jgi:hypothetical protein